MEQQVRFCTTSDGVRIAYSLRYAPSPDDTRAYLDPERMVLVDAGDVQSAKVKLTTEQFRKDLTEHPRSTQEEIADRLGVSVATIRRKRTEAKKEGWLREEKTPPNNKLVLWADAEAP